MKLYRLERRQSLAIGIHAAWDFFSQPRNLPMITPPWLKFVVTSSLSERMHAGMIVTYRLQPLFGIPVSWVSEITHVREPDHFVDEQRYGPFRFWHHAHFFTVTPTGIDMRDLVHYNPGYGFLGRLIRALLLRDRLNNIFDYREQTLMRLFGDRRPSHAEGTKNVKTRSGGSAQRGSQLV
jgi:ligand-binding SRPBCC domain-containing protein